MRIDAYNQVAQAYGVNKVKKASSAYSAGGAGAIDQVSFSSIGRDMQIAKTALANVPDIREDKVAAIKSAIADGTYNVSNETFAEKLASAYAEKAI